MMFMGFRKSGVLDAIDKSFDEKLENPFHDLL